MTSDLDIYRSANELIKQYGEAANIEAAMIAPVGVPDRAIMRPVTGRTRQGGEITTKRAAFAAKSEKFFSFPVSRCFYLIIR